MVNLGSVFVVNLLMEPLFTFLNLIRLREDDLILREPVLLASCNLPYYCTVAATRSQEYWTQ